MKTMNKLLAVLLALTMVLSLGISAFAAEGDEEPDTTVATQIVKTANDEHTYEIYQIFTGDYYDGKLSNIVWGENGTGTTGNKVESEVLDALADVVNGNDASKLTVILNNVELLSPKYSLGKDEAEVTVDPGYYIIVDTTVFPTGVPAVGTASDARNLNVVGVAGTVTIARKTGSPSSDKKVKDANDSTDTADTVNGWQDSADHDVGDSVEFQLHANIPSGLKYYTEYEMIFHDKQSEGLTLNSDSFKVVVGSKTLTEGTDYTVETGLTDGCTFHVVISNLKDHVDVDAADVYVTYTSTLNEKAKRGKLGNPNEMYLEYDNNPNADGSGTGNTPWDKVIVFTYDTIVTKVDENNKPLDGAAFVLYKEIQDASKLAANEVETINGKTYKIINATVSATSVETENGTETKNNIFTFKGLDDGNYLLRETETPSGYNGIADMTFTINADHEIESNDPALNELTVGNPVNINLSADTTDGKLSSDVVNIAGTVLPSTGGIGTTLFYVIGSVLMLAAVVLLITRKKMSTYQD